MKRWQVVAMVVGLSGGVCAQAQQSLAEANRLHPDVMTHAVAESIEPATSLEDAVHILFAQADVVFAGTVTKIDKADGTVTVRFRVDDAIRGVTAGSTYTLREWSGLWADDASRYVEGERRLMLLHAASSAGYASPVCGSRGAIHLRGDVAQQVLDLRLIAAEVNAASPIARAMSVLSASAAPQDSGAVDGMVLTDMLHAWQRTEVTQ